MAHVNASMLDLSEITIAMDSRQSSLELNSFKVSVINLFLLILKKYSRLFRLISSMTVCDLIVISHEKNKNKRAL